MHAKVFDLLNQKLATNDALKPMVETLAKANADALLKNVFRFKPQFDTPREGRVWVWTITLCEHSDAIYSEHLQALSKMRRSDIGFAPQHSADGPIDKSITGKIDPAGHAAKHVKKT